MKAAVLHKLGDPPKYQDFPDVIPRNEDQVILHVKASAIKNIDKLRASGKHYASYTQLPVVVGMDGTGLLEDGRRVYAMGITGMLAEKTLIPKNGFTILPENIDFITAAALPNALAGAAMALRFRAKMEKAEVILINGATSVTGQIAVQVARHYGASKIIATGRNPESLQKLKNLGADSVISLNQNDEDLIKEISEVHRQTPVNIIIDYLWGHPIELIISALKGVGMNSITSRVRIVTVGSVAGENIQLNSAILRSSAIEILGSGIGSISQQEMQIYLKEVLPEMFQLAAEGKLQLDCVTTDLKNIEEAWNQVVAPGKRLVVKV
jgi:NADPH:quinone reductase-like Zn-dependent oxidoreductase